MGDVGQDFGRYAHDSEPIGEADPAVEFGDPRGQVVAGVQADRSSEAVVLFGRRGLVVSDARVRQSGMTAARTGRISKEGSAEARRVLVEAAWSAKRVPGPLRAFGQRLQARRGPQIATVAVARKIAVLCWHLLTRAEDYAHHRPTLHRRKLRKLELRAGAPSQQGKHNANPIWETRTQDEREATSSPSPKPATSAPSPTERPADPSRARAPHRGAHSKQRGRTKPQILLSSSRSPAPGRTLPKEARTIQTT